MFVHNSSQEVSFLPSSSYILLVRTYNQVLVYHMEIPSALVLWVHPVPCSLKTLWSLPLKFGDTEG
jgi:hypothetical protein